MSWFPGSLIILNTRIIVLLPPPRDIIAMYVGPLVKFPNVQTRFARAFIKDIRQSVAQRVQLPVWGVVTLTFPLRDLINERLC